MVLLLNCLAFAILPTTSDGEDRAPTRPGGGSPESLGDSPRAAVSRASVPPTSSASLPAPILSTSLPAPHLLYRDTHHNSPQHGWPLEGRWESWYPLGCWGPGERVACPWQGGLHESNGSDPRKPKEETLSLVPLCVTSLCSLRPRSSPSLPSLPSSSLFSCLLPHGPP